MSSVDKITNYYQVVTTQNRSHPLLVFLLSIRYGKKYFLLVNSTRLDVVILIVISANSFMDVVEKRWYSSSY